MGRGTTIRCGLPALAAACAALVLPAASPAATVGVEEQETEPRQAKLVFAAGAGEANDLTVSVAGEEGLYYDLRLLDATAPVTPGQGCSGGGAPGVVVHCKVHKPTPGDNIECFKGCRYTPGTKWEMELAFELGDAGSRLDTTAIPADALDPQHPWRGHVWAPVEVTVTPGAGDDTVLTGPGRDLIEASPGADLVRTGGGSDEFRGGPRPDGPDDVDLGEGDSEAIDYSERGESVHYDPNGLADDGGAGEGDNLDAASSVQTGAGADTLVAPETLGAALYGGAGDDTIHGRSRSDEIYGGEGDDELFGAEGDDWLLDPSYGGRGGNSGDDVASGGAGRDEIRLGGGDDEASGGAEGDQIAGGPGDDRVTGDAGGDEIELGPGRDRGAGGAGSDLLFGEEGADEIDGEQGADRISGDVGRDSLFGGAGGDRIAAGMAVADERELRYFLGSTGPLEGKADRVDCGAGWDGAKTGRGDSTAACESTPRAELLEIQALEQSDGEQPPHLRCVIRRAGRIELVSKGLQPKERVSGLDYAAWGAPLWPVGRALATLLRTGQVKVPLTIVFHAAGGRDVARTRTVRLFLPGGLHSRRPAAAT
ncbi:MAG TPA: calcium-binding protein [Solirubrobacterales bacterium]|jgi:Ca2+-binding RTX toxin-like protein